MFLVLAQVNLPTQGDNPWIWLCGALTLALGYMFLRYDASKEARAKRAEDQADKLALMLPEIVAAVRELLEAKNERPPTRRS